ncbi:MAG: bifunctional riboflavin kinase/FAD synthetase, partial [Firmicutes bacterium]|nr:bifunctional riboflavin kinase/FAD synthetase [Bacillota bacterium]
MQIIDCDQKDRPLSADQSMALGNFDGIHRGHQSLIHRAMDFAQQEKIHSSVLLFKQHTLEEI